jgi:hypothetical protein
MAIWEVHFSRPLLLSRIRVSFVACTISRSADQTTLQTKIVTRMEGLAVSLSMVLNTRQVCILFIVSSTKANITTADQVLTMLYVMHVKWTDPANPDVSILLGYLVINWHGPLNSLEWLPILLSKFQEDRFLRSPWLVSTTASRLTYMKRANALIYCSTYWRIWDNPQTSEKSTLSICLIQ